MDLPYARIGKGPHPLVVLTGLELENAAPTGAALTFLRLAYRRLGRHFTIYQVTRRKQLPSGWTTRDMAVDHAAWMEKVVGPAHVIGVSTGGEVAQHLAADRPDLVHRLVISDSGYRLGDEAKALLRAVREEATAGRAAQGHLMLSAHMDMGYAGAALLRVLGKQLIREPEDASDYIRTIDADLDHDSSERLSHVAAPTLVIGGGADYFYPEPILRETAGRVPNASLKLYEGVGHPVVKSRRRDYERDVLAFLLDA